MYAMSSYSPELLQHLGLYVKLETCCVAELFINELYLLEAYLNLNMCCTAIRRLRRCRRLPR